jgi:hypothetical protein
MGVQSSSTLARVCIGPLNALATGDSNTEGIRMNPCNLSESVCLWLDNI